MHYYKRNIGDYSKKAGRLSMIQHGSYTLLIDACYDREKFPTLAEAIEWTWASSPDEIEAVEFVLRKFFVLDGGVYVQKRIQEEIAEFHGKSETNRRIAIERETKRRENSTNRAPVVNEPPPNHKPLTNNHKPVREEAEKQAASPSSKFDAKAELVRLGAEHQTADDWLSLRKAKKAPVSQTALSMFEREVEKSGLSINSAMQTCCERGWAGFKAAWVQADKQASATHDKFRGAK